MLVRTLPKILLLISAAVCACASPLVVFGQTPSNQSDEVIKVTTTLVQTDVMVFDKQGSFVDGLKREQFVLKVDGKPREISFFERVRAGSRNEEAQLAAARGNSSGVEGNSVTPLDRGRTVFFFADDLHLSAGSMHHTRALLRRFVDREMGQNDEAGIATTSGQLGFLQQLTDNKAVLRAAIERLKARPSSALNVERPPMSEFQALRVDRNDRDVLDFYVEHVMRDIPGVSRETAIEIVKGRASQILHLAASITTRTLAALESMIKNGRQVPGRKVLFLVSDGFFLDERNSDSHSRLNRITSLAAAAGFVIYSIDARGLTTGMADAATETASDPTGRLQRGGSGELTASQDGLNALAKDTGGRAFFNTNALSAAVTSALKESSAYYLLAWRPETEEQKNEKFRRIEVSVLGRPELVARFRRGFGDEGAVEAASRQAKTTPSTDKQRNELLLDTLRSQYPRRSLPVGLLLNFISDRQSGLTLAASVEITTKSLKLVPSETPAATVDVVCNIFDDQGKSVGGFSKRMTIKARSSTATELPDSILYNHLATVKPGLYQVRVAAMDLEELRVGSASQWIEIPNLDSKTLAMSSLIVSEKAGSDPQKQDPKPNTTETAMSLLDMMPNVDHRFTRASRLRFLTFVYNAARNGAVATNSSATVPASATNSLQVGFDLAVQVQVFRDNEPIVTAPLSKVAPEGAYDAARIPYAADVLLDELQPGRYVLQVTIIDRIAKATASQKYEFQVD